MLLEHSGTRVHRLIDTVTDAHDAAALALDLALKPFLRVAEIRDLIEHAHRRFVRAAVLGPLERANRGSDCAVHVAVGAGHHARGKRAGVHAVVSQQHEVDVERVDLGLVRLVALEHVDEVLCNAHVLARLNHRLARTNPFPRGNDRRHLRRQAHRLAQIRVGAVVFGGGIVQAQRGNRRAQHGHRMCAHRVTVHALKLVFGQAHFVH